MSCTSIRAPTFVSSLDSVAKMPLALHLSTLSYLAVSDLTSCSLVSSRWKVIAIHPQLWEKLSSELIKQLFGQLKASTLHSTDFYRKIMLQHLDSNDQIVRSIEVFLKKIKVGQSVQYTCYLGRGAKYQTICIALCPRREKKKNSDYIFKCASYDITKSYFSVKVLINGNLTKPPVIYKIKSCEVKTWTLGNDPNRYGIITPSYEAIIYFSKMPTQEYEQIKQSIRALVECKLDELNEEISSTTTKSASKQISYAPAQ